MNLYSDMAHCVAEVLGQRPNDILDNWGVAELLVAYGYYTNIKSSQYFEEWKHASKDIKKSMDRPDEHHVRFFAPEDIEDEEEGE